MHGNSTVMLQHFANEKPLCFYQFWANSSTLQAYFGNLCHVLCNLNPLLLQKLHCHFTSSFTSCELPPQ